MAYPIVVKEKAIKLRLKGFSIKEIAEILRIGVGTSSVWLRDIELNNGAQKRLQERKLLSRYKTILTFKKRRERLLKTLSYKSKRVVEKHKTNKSLCKIYCALLYWAEGAKDFNLVNFTNSDIKTVTLFLHLLRKAHKIDEKKLHARLHLHEYHDESSVKTIWASSIKINPSQFYKSYHKPHTGKRKRSNYPGCINIHYYDSKIALDLNSIYNSLVSHLLGV